MCHWLTRFLAAFFTASIATATAVACPFCTTQGTTLTGDASQAALVVYGTLENPRLSSDPSELNRGTTDLRIETIVKDHPILKGQRVLTLPRYVPLDAKKPTKYLVFCDVYMGKLDPYRGVAVRDGSQVAEYLSGALKVKDKNTPTRLRFFFDYLDSEDAEVSADAYLEFGLADYKDYRDLAKQFPAAKIARWLEDPNTPSNRLGTFGSLLGHCGTAEHADLLRRLLDDPKKRFSSGFDGILAGYILLAPKAGWAYLQAVLKDEKREFMVRYAALRTARFFWDYRPDIIPAQDVAKALEPLLNQSDIADLPIEDLRKRKHFEWTDRILELFDRPSHSASIIRRAIMRFALSAAKTNPKAADFVAAQRKKNADWVNDVEELLKLEEARPMTKDIQPPSKPPVLTP